MTAKKSKTAVGKTPEPKSKEQELNLARAVLRPSINAAAVITEYGGKTFGELDVMALAEVLAERSKEVSAGDMETVEAMLIDQAHALQAIFMSFARRTLNQEYMKNTESFMRMALKAQNQCRMTLETLATVKNPPVVFAKQANISNGPQQVNNGVPAPASPAHEEKEIRSTGLLTEDQHGATLDTRGTAAASGTDKAMATLGEVHRPGN